MIEFTFSTHTTPWYNNFQPGNIINVVASCRLQGPGIELMDLLPCIMMIIHSEWLCLSVRLSLDYQTVPEYQPLLFETNYCRSSKPPLPSSACATHAISGIRC